MTINIFTCFRKLHGIGPYSTPKEVNIVYFDVLWFFDFWLEEIAKYAFLMSC